MKLLLDVSLLNQKLFVQMHLLSSGCSPERLVSDSNWEGLILVSSIVSRIACRRPLAAKKKNTPKPSHSHLSSILCAMAVSY